MDNVQSDKTEKTSLQAAMEAGTGACATPEGVDERKPGAILAAKRKAAGIAEEQIASRLKMTLRQLQALEADDYDTLHGIAISRGFVRAYARVLKIDPEPLVAMFGKSNPCATMQIPGKGMTARAGEPFVQNQVSFRKKSNLTGKIIILLIVLVIAAVVAWNMKLFSFDRHAAKADKPPVVSEQAAPSVRDDKPEVKVPEQKTAEQKATENTLTVQAKEQESQSASTGSDNEKTATQAAVAVQSSGSKSDQESAQQAVSNAASRLNINFSEKSWVRVQGNDGTVLAEYMGVPGEQRSLDVNGPVTVIVGYAPGVSMTFRGAPVDLGSRAVNSVARVTLK